MSDTEQQAPLVRVREARHAFGTRRALDGLSLEIVAGEIYALLGPNGAGKTTLVRALSGRLVPAGGRVEVAGLPPATSRRARSAIGLVPQQIALYPALTCRENLAAFARLMGARSGAIAGRVGEVLEAIGLADRARDRAGTLSGGMQRRLNIGAAVMHRPRFLILDEPTVGVDLHAKEAIHKLLLGFRAEGMGVLLTTHDMDQAASIADRVGIIAGGRLRAEGTPDGLVADAFGGAKQVAVTLDSPPSEPARAWLRGRGLHDLRGGAFWTGRFDGGYEDVARLDTEMRSAGLQPSEIAIREPSLKSVFFEAVGPALTPDDPATGENRP